MAVSTYTGSNTTSWSDFVAWLNSNKSGTFLEDCTVEAGTTAEDIFTGSDTCYGYPLIISNSANNDSFKAYVVNGQRFQYQGGNFNYARLYKNSGASIVHSASVYNNNGTYNANMYFNSAILCTNGLILKMYVPYRFQSSGIDYMYAYVLLTRNSEGNFAMVCAPVAYTYTSAAPNANCGCSVRSTTSAAAVNVSMTTTLNSAKTSIAPIGLQENSDSVTLDSFYQAVTTQLTALNLVQVAVGSEIYITNGIWYVKD